MAVNNVDNLTAKKKTCLAEIETEFKELVSVLGSRKLILQNQVEEIMKEMKYENNSSPNIVFTRDTTLKQTLKSFGEIHRKTQLQAKSPPPLNTLSPINPNLHNTAVYSQNTGVFQFGISLDENVREAHPTKLSDTRIVSPSNTFKPLCMKKFEEKLFVVSQDEFIYVIDETTGKVLRRIVVNFGLFFPAITIAEDKIVFGHSGQYGGKIWIFCQSGELSKEVVDVPQYGRIKLLSDLEVTMENRVLIVDSDTNLVLVTNADITKVEERIGRNGQLMSPTRVAVNTNNELYILHNRGRKIDVFTLKDESLRSFNLQHQSFDSEHIRYNPDLLVTDKYLTLTFDNLLFVYNFKTGIFSQANLEGISGVIPKCIVTIGELMVAIKHDVIVRYSLDYFD